jgi:hypothetical protein
MIGNQLLINYGINGANISGGGGTSTGSGMGNTPGSIYCFLEGSTILCQVDGEDIQVPIEKITGGTQVKTSQSGYKRTVIIGKSQFKNCDSKNCLYKYSKENHPELEKDLCITGRHSVLVDSLTEKQAEETAKHLNLLFVDDVEKIFVTESKCRLMAYLDDRATPLATEGFFTVWHLALENSDDKGNYGIYANGNFLVESCSISNMNNITNC